MKRTNAPHQPSDGAQGSGGVGEAEAVLVERYPHLVRLAYLLLPPALGRHRRVLGAHATVQRALPRSARAVRRALAAREAPHPDPVYDLLRLRVVRGALARQRPGRGLPGWRRGPSGAPAALPAVFGLRLFPEADGPDALALDQALAELDAATRAAFVLRRLEGLTDGGLRRLLSEAGVADPAAAAQAAQQVRLPAEAARDGRLLSTEFDAHAVQLRPTDLMRRRTRRRASLAAALALLLAAGGTGFALSGADVGSDADDGAPLAGAARSGADAGWTPDRLARVPGDRWADSARVDFTAWPARGDRRDDDALVERAVNAWSQGEERAAPASTTPGTPAAPPTGRPQLLWAGDVGESAVVVLLDGTGSRLARFTEPRDGGAGDLSVSRTDSADVTTAAALAVHRDGEGVRYLTAPWIEKTEVRDLAEPDAPARPLARDGEGLTAPVPSVAPRAGCGARTALQLTSSARIVDDHAFLLTDLGEPLPAHLTWTPAPRDGVPPGRPVEAVSGEALRAWAPAACDLDGLRRSGVRAVGTWEFARQDLPDDGGDGAWTCTRADTWQGDGRVVVRLRDGGSGPGVLAARARDTAACSRFGQHLLAGARWKSPDGEWYQLAAGSRAVTSIQASGSAEGSADGPTLALPSRSGADEADLRARLTTGGELKPLE